MVPGAVEFVPAVPVGANCSVLVMVVCEVSRGKSAEAGADADAGADAGADASAVVAGVVSFTTLVWTRAEETRIVDNGSKSDGVASDEAADGTGV